MGTLDGGIVQGPGYCVEEPGDGVLRDAAHEEGGCGQGAEGVVVYFGVGGRGATGEEMGVG